LSTFDRIELKAPEMKVNVITPNIINQKQKNYSGVVTADMSPYPTVVIVVTVK
jgi:hypothetical protein